MAFIRFKYCSEYFKLISYDVFLSYKLFFLKKDKYKEIIYDTHNCDKNNKSILIELNGVCSKFLNSKSNKSICSTRIVLIIHSILVVLIILINNISSHIRNEVVKGIQAGLNPSQIIQNVASSSIAVFKYLRCFS